MNWQRRRFSNNCHGIVSLRTVIQKIIIGEWLQRRAFENHHNRHVPYETCLSCNSLSLSHTLTLSSHLCLSFFSPFVHCCRTSLIVLSLNSPEHTHISLFSLYLFSNQRSATFSLSLFLSHFLMIFPSALPWRNQQSHPCHLHPRGTQPLGFTQGVSSSSTTSCQSRANLNSVKA